MNNADRHRLHGVVASVMLCTAVPGFVPAVQALALYPADTKAVFTLLCFPLLPAALRAYLGWQHMAEPARWASFATLALLTASAIFAIAVALLVERGGPGLGASAARDCIVSLVLGWLVLALRRAPAERPEKLRGHTQVRAPTSRTKWPSKNSLGHRLHGVVAGAMLLGAVTGVTEVLRASAIAGDDREFGVADAVATLMAVGIRGYLGWQFLTGHPARWVYFATLLLLGLSLLAEGSVGLGSTSDDEVVRVTLLISTAQTALLSLALGGIVIALDKMRSESGPAAR